MLLILVMFLCLPLAIFFSVLASFTIRKQNASLGNVILVSSLLAATSILWEMRFDIPQISNLFTYDQLSMDFQSYALILYIALFAMILRTRWRWTSETGNPILLNLSLAFWIFSTSPIFLITSGAFLH